MTAEQLRKELVDFGIDSRLEDVICDPCDDTEPEGANVLDLAVNIIHEEVGYLRKVQAFVEELSRKDLGDQQ